jgi:hypothetical protein
MVRRNVILRRVRKTIVAVEKQLSVSAALVIQHATRMRRIILSCAVCLALPYSSTLTPKRHDFWRNLLNKNVSFNFLYNICVKHFSF